MGIGKQIIKTEKVMPAEAQMPNTHTKLVFVFDHRLVIGFNISGIHSCARFRPEKAYATEKLQVPQ